MRPEPETGRARRWWKTALISFGLAEDPLGRPSVRGPRGDERVAELEARSTASSASSRRSGATAAPGDVRRVRGRVRRPSRDGRHRLPRAARGPMSGTCPMRSRPSPSPQRARRGLPWTPRRPGRWSSGRTSGWPSPPGGTARRRSTDRRSRRCSPRRAAVAAGAPRPRRRAGRRPGARPTRAAGSRRGRPRSRRSRAARRGGSAGARCSAATRAAALSGPAGRRTTRRRRRRPAGRGGGRPRRAAGSHVSGPVRRIACAQWPPRAHGSALRGRSSSG